MHVIVAHGYGRVTPDAQSLCRKPVAIVGPRSHVFRRNWGRGPRISNRMILGHEPLQPSLRAPGYAGFDARPGDPWFLGLMPLASAGTVLLLSGWLVDKIWPPRGACCPADYRWVVGLGDVSVNVRIGITSSS